MYNVMTMSKPKDAFLQIRIREEIKRELAILAELRGLSMSALINSLIVKAIREEKEISPHEFDRTASVVATISPAEHDDIDEIRRQLQKGIEIAPRSRRPIPVQRTSTTKAKRSTR